MGDIEPARLEAQVAATLERLAGPRPVGVALSGGGDSTALLALAEAWTHARGRTVSAATVDHGLRPESAAEAEAAGRLCAELGVGHSVLPWHDHPETGNLQAAAREARFRLLGDWARRVGLSAVLLGHTLDDQAETVLMRLARGSGADGLAGMAAETEIAGMRWLRPLLEIRRSALRAYLESREIGWSEDPSNADPRFDRVKAREALAELEPLGVTPEGLAETAHRLARQRRVLDRARDALADTARRWGSCGEAVLDKAALRAAEEDTVLRLIADTLMRISGAVYRPRLAALERVWQELRGASAGGATLAGCQLSATARAIAVCREPEACAGPLGLAESCVWDGRWQVTASGRWPDSKVAALGELGIAALRGAARRGVWQPPAAWLSAPHPARLSSPAVWAEGELVAAPCADYLAPETAAGSARIAVSDLAAGAPSPARRGLGS